MGRPEAAPYTRSALHGHFNVKVGASSLQLLERSKVRHNTIRANDLYQTCEAFVPSRSIGGSRRVELSD